MMQIIYYMKLFYRGKEEHNSNIAFFLFISIIKFLTFSVTP